MRKPPLQDVIVKPTTRRDMSPRLSNEHATITPRRRVVEQDHTFVSEPSREHPKHAHPPQDMRKHFSRSTDINTVQRSLWPIVVLLVGAVMIGTAFVLSLVFSGANVRVYPKQDTFVADVTLVATVDGFSSGIAVQRVALEQTAIRDVIALTEEEVEERARGTITVYNEYSSSPQRLIPQTRFMDDTGRIYRIQKPIEVPGQKSDGTPGSITASVVAEEPGEDYNRGPGEFSVPGFENAPQEGKIYARSDEPFTGGFVGIKRDVGEADRLTAIQELESQLRDELLARLATNEGAPEGYQLYPGSAFFEFNALPDESAEAGTVRVSLSGVLHAIAYPKDALAQNLAHNLIGSYAGSPIRIENIEELTISATAQNALTPEDETNETFADEGIAQPWDATSYDVRVTGKAQFIWEFDTEALRESLAGRPKQDLEGGMSDELRNTYPGIDYVHATSRPFWKRALPRDSADIHITVVLDE